MYINMVEKASSEEFDLQLLNTLKSLLFPPS